jgi:hypothetical protein
MEFSLNILKNRDQRTGILGAAIDNFLYFGRVMRHGVTSS